MRLVEKCFFHKKLSVSVWLDKFRHWLRPCDTAEMAIGLGYSQVASLSAVCQRRRWNVRNRQTRARRPGQQFSSDQIWTQYFSHSHNDVQLWQKYDKFWFHCEYIQTHCLPILSMDATELIGMAVLWLEHNSGCIDNKLQKNDIAHLLYRISIMLECFVYHLCSTVYAFENKNVHFKTSASVHLWRDVHVYSPTISILHSLSAARSRARCK